MQYILQNTKRLISICLVTLLLVTSTLLSFPTPARADTDIVILKCETECGNMPAFTAGTIAGSAVTLAATGNGSLAAAGTTAIVDMASAAAAPLAAMAVPVVAAAAPIVVPVAVGTAVVGGGYLLWQQSSQAFVPKLVQRSDSAKQK